jgi:hypothetical protein
MRWLLQASRVVISVLILMLYSVAYSQDKFVDKYELNGFFFSIETNELDKITNGCGAFLSKVRVMNGSKIVFNEVICVVEIDDIGFRQKGYLTIIEHYSSPVGWSQFYIFDVCKKRLIRTKKIEEGTELNWSDFINPSPLLSTKFIEKMIQI